MRSGSFHWPKPADEMDDPFAEPFEDRGVVPVPESYYVSRWSDLVDVPEESTGGRFSEVPLSQPAYNMDGSSPPTPLSTGCSGCRSGNGVTPPPGYNPLIVLGAVAAIGIGLAWWVTRK